MVHNPNGDTCCLQLQSLADGPTSRLIWSGFPHLNQVCHPTSRQSKGNLDSGQALSSLVMEILTAALDVDVKKAIFIYCPEKSRRKGLSVAVNNCKHPGNRGSFVFPGHGCYLVISGFYVNNQTHHLCHLFICAIAILSSLLKRGRIFKKKGRGIFAPVT